MSNARIRVLLNEQLTEGLRQPDETLKYPVLPNGVQEFSLDETHIISHLMPAPVINGTLGGDHRGFTGVYQMTIKASNEIEGTETVTDMNLVIEEVAEALQDAFPINKRIGVEGEFVVQVLSSISVTEATYDKNDKWWLAHAYFSYRADTN